jgi:hypothetical protein
VHAGVAEVVCVQGVGRPLQLYVYGVAPPVGDAVNVTLSPVSTLDLLADGAPTFGSEVTAKLSVPLVAE